MASSSPPTSPASNVAADLLSFYRLVGRLKTIKRTGWVRAGVSLPESISDHMYRMSIMALTASAGVGTSNGEDVGIDFGHATKLALVHDLAEAIVGDITPYDGVSKEDKQRMETEAMERIRREYFGADKGAGDIGEELVRLWAEYENGETKEARFVKQLDKLEMLIQADEYEREQNMDLSDFFSSTKSSLFSSNLLQQIDSTVREQRQKYIDSKADTNNKS